MIPISDAFRAELQKQIRGKGRNRLTFYFPSGGSPYVVPENLVQSVEMHSTGDPLCRTLPIEECTIVLLDFDELWNPANENGYYARTTEGTTVYVEIGIDTDSGTEWAEACIYKTDKNVTWQNKTAKFHCIRDLQSFDSNYDGLGQSNNLQDQAVDCLWSGYPKDWRPAYLDYYVSDKMAETRVIAHANVTGKAKKDALLTMAFAGRCAVRTTHDGQISIRDYFVEEPEYNLSRITDLDIMTEPQIDVLPLAGFERVNFLANPSTEAQETVLNVSGDYDIDSDIDDPVFIAFSKPITPNSATITTQNVTNATFYYQVRRSGIRITGIDRQDQAQPWEISVVGTVQNPIKKQSYERIFARTEASGGAVEEIENPLLNADSEYIVAMYRGRYLRRTRNSYKFNYRGDPSIEAFDTLRVNLPMFGESLCIVTEHTFRHGAGFSGSITVRRIDKNLATDHDGLSAAADFALADFAEADRE